MQNFLIREMVISGFSIKAFRNTRFESIVSTFVAGKTDCKYDLKYAIPNGGAYEGKTNVGGNTKDTFVIIIVD